MYMRDRDHQYKALGSFLVESHIFSKASTLTLEVYPGLISAETCDFVYKTLVKVFDVIHNAAMF